MSQWLWFFLMFTCGALLAAIYLGTLWLTVQHIHNARHPALWLITSLLARMLLVVAVFYLILGDGHWQRLLAALSGFVILRIVTLDRIRQRLAVPAGAREKTA